MRPGRIWYDPPHVRWGRVAVTVLIASALVALWVAQRRGLFDPAPERVVPALSPVASAMQASAVAPRESADGSAPGALAAAAPAKAASSVEIICGLGPVNIDPGDEAQAERVAAAAQEKLEAHRKRVLPGWLEEMKSSSDEQVQAAAWFLEAREAWTRRAEAGQGPEALDAVNELARLAQRSRDPLAYALAFQSCETLRGAAAASACEGLSVEAWAERDPGNAYPWLFGAGRDSLDARLRTRYVDSMLASTFMRGTWGALVPVMARAAPPAEAPLDRSVRFLEAMSLDSFVSLTQGGVVGHCKESDLRNGARRQQCEYLATFLTEKADTFLEAGLGNAIGKRLGWSQDRLDRLKAEQENLQQALPRGVDAGGCAGLARTEAYFTDVAKYGEIGALRRRAAAAGSTTAAAGR